jgi:hypothetical protein
MWNSDCCSREICGIGGLKTKYPTSTSGPKEVDMTGKLALIMAMVSLLSGVGAEQSYGKEGETSFELLVTKTDFQSIDSGSGPITVYFDSNFPQNANNEPCGSVLASDGTLECTLSIADGCGKIKYTVRLIPSPDWWQLEPVNISVRTTKNGSTCILSPENVTVAFAGRQDVYDQMEADITHAFGIQSGQVLKDVVERRHGTILDIPSGTSERSLPALAEIAREPFGAARLGWLEQFSQNQSAWADTQHKDNVAIAHQGCMQALVNQMLILAAQQIDTDMGGQLSPSDSWFAFRDNVIKLEQKWKQAGALNAELAEPLNLVANLRAQVEKGQLQNPEIVIVKKLLELTRVLGKEQVGSKHASSNEQ